MTGDTKINRRLAKFTRDGVTTARDARKALVRIVDLLEARSKEIVSGFGDDGLEIYDRVALTPEDRLSNLRAARVWIARADNQLRHLESVLDRAIEVAERNQH